MGLRVDFEFISKLEGGCSELGYVPAAENSQSGVTIASGLDLGARNLADLKQLGLSQDMVRRLTPYLGLKRKDAEKALKALPLRISASECVHIDQRIKNHYITALALRYNSALQPGKIPFEDLPSAMQTVITSVSFQHGLNLAKTAPKFWRAVTDQDWASTLKILRDFQDLFPTRRRIEANLLEQAL
ncbi:pesticin C-terminus-like muramidase [Limnobacter humi]|uniref:Pesticin C-terminus-like muramidase n=1 Tax=Limnobacter humi TaxID=1778671 RepID=A0ABT1WC94_9BURK|nr:pesticin C-terminus-like muramidase [Limnobacter humi]MCQ8895144.1 pesticin C-terminus-like muramidase [Limnobacter humi]